MSMYEFNISDIAATGVEMATAKTQTHAKPQQMVAPAGPQYYFDPGVNMQTTNGNYM